MRFGIAGKPIVTIYEGSFTTKETLEGKASAISDEMMYGMLAAVTGKTQHGFVPIRTYYGYTGFVKEQDLLMVSEEQARVWEASQLMVVNGFYTDITTIPKVQGMRLIGLYRGSLVQVEEYESKSNGWARIRLPDGKAGYMRNQYLWKKEFSQAGLWMGRLPQKKIVDDEAFRDAVVKTAGTYMGVQYRWGGRSTAGIDCSGLTSESYMLNGILIYRDGKIVEEYPVHEIPKENIRKGDLLYFTGHIAMYIGEGRFIHSTGKVGSGGVAVNSLNPGEEEYRQDLRDSFYAAGSIF